MGSSLSNYIGVAILLFTSALVNGGQFSCSWLEQKHFAAVVDDVPADTIVRLIDEEFSAVAAPDHAGGPAEDG